MALVVATALLAAGASSAKATSRGDVSVLALIPAPGYPALPHVVGNLIYEGTYANPAGDSVPSRVLQYTADGTLQGQPGAARARDRGSGRYGVCAGQFGHDHPAGQGQAP